MYVIGTAGHVDHGKSTLVEALTGIDPDRLAEEKERELTIDLGFAWLSLGENDDLEEVGIVDVPGHRDFIENMLAGVGGIDLALLVVAADEGVMPQTREHLAILDLLDVRGGVVALTKSDLIDDDDWLELVTLDLSDTLAGTVLEEAPIIAVSGRTGDGLETLRETLADRLRATGPQTDAGRPRLPIDRVFSLAGFGTVVTGTLVGGQLRVGDEVEIQPSKHRGRIRGLQTHKVSRDVARPGSRVAVNVSGVDTDQVNRGDVLAAPGIVRGTILLDAAYRHLPEADKPLRHNVEVKLFVGAAEVIARTRVLGARQIDPGESGWLQFALQHPVAAVRGDRFILRRPSPPATIGGGRILDPHPGRRHRRFRPEVVERLQTLAQGDPEEILQQRLARIEPANPNELFRQAGLDEETAERAWENLLQSGRVVLLGQQALTQSTWQRFRKQMQETITDYHKNYPLRPGMPREELRSRLRLTASVFNPLLARAVGDGLLVESSAVVRAPGHEIRFSSTQQEKIDVLLQRFRRAGVNSPSVKESRAVVGDDVYEALVALGKLQPLNEDVVYRTEEYEDLVKQITNHLQKRGRANAAEIRDLLDTSRKYAIALLEHLDEIRVTRRVGDDREVIEGRSS